MPAQSARSRKRGTKTWRPETEAPEGDLKLIERNGNFHVRGTVQHAGQSRRVRESLHIVFLEKNRPAAEAAARNLETQVRRELGGDIPPLACAEVSQLFITRPKGKELGVTDLDIIKKLTAHFGMRRMRDIRPAEFVYFVDAHMRDNTSETRERFLNTICAYITEAIRIGQYDEMPNFKRDKRARNPNRRARRPVSAVRSYILQLLIESSHIAIASQLCTEAATGGRVSSVLFGCALEDLIMTPGAMQITFHDTKNDDDVPAALPESVRLLMEGYLAWRQLQVDAGRVSAARSAPLFLTPRGYPYKPNPNYTGTRNKTGFNAAKKRALAKLERSGNAAIATLEAAGDAAGAAQARQVLAEDIKILKALTQHWLRHMLASALGRLDLRLAMRQGGWRDVRSVQGYLIDDAELQRNAVEGRVLFETPLERVLFDTNVTRNGADDDDK